MAYVRKTHDEYTVEGFYCGGWNTEFVAATREEARSVLRDYRRNCPDTAYRVTKHRIPNDQTEKEE